MKERAVMKINFYRNGKTRTSITIPDVLARTWASTRPNIQTESELTGALKMAIEAIPEPTGQSTFQQYVEKFLLSDIQEFISGLQLEIERLKN